MNATRANLRRFIVPGLCVLAALIAGVLELNHINATDHQYRVRAIFDNAEALAPGEDVTVAGSVVGTIASLDVTPGYKAVVNLRIADRRFVPFHANAHCLIRSEGVLAVKYVDCDPGSSPAAALAPIASGAGAGSHLLSVAHTTSPVDLDLVTNAMRAPTGQQLSILINELGTGLAARGSDLNAVIHRANPGLAETDRVVKLLAQQNHALAGLARDADRVLAPLSAQRQAIARFIVGADATTVATANRSVALAASIQRLPHFLAALRPLMVQLGTLTQQGTPVLAQLRGAAPGLDRAIGQLQPFAKAGGPAVRELGTLAQRGGNDLVQAGGVVGDLASLARAWQPAASNLEHLTQSFESANGIKRFMQLAFYATNDVNGFDKYGHYARVEPISGACSQYTSYGWLGCSSKFNNVEAKHIKVSLGSGSASLHALVNYLLR